MLGALKIRARCRTVFAAGFGHRIDVAFAGCGQVLISVLTGFSVAFAAIAAITVT